MVFSIIQTNLSLIMRSFLSMVFSRRGGFGLMYGFGEADPSELESLRSAGGGSGLLESLLESCLARRLGGGGV